MLVVYHVLNMDSVKGDWLDNGSKEDIIKQISRLRKNIKKKHRALKRGIVEGEELLENTFKPITDPLKKLVEETGIANDEFIENIENKHKRKIMDSPIIGELSTPIKRKILNPFQGVKRKKKVNLRQQLNYNNNSDSDDGLNIENQNNSRLSVPIEVKNVEMAESQADEAQTPDVEIFESQPTGEELLRTPEGRDLSKLYIDRHFTGKLAKEYFSKLISGLKSVDHNYGVIVQGNDWKIGDKQLEVDHDDLIVGDKRYVGTRGLYELIFMNNPNEYIYSEEDLDNYAKIVFDTNVYRVNFSPTGKIRSNRGRKYKNILSQILSKGPPQDAMDTYTDQALLINNPTGSGILLTDAKPNIVYYDDPNEIVNRLRVLMGSKEAGHTGHENEINAILEELKEMESQLL